MGRQQRRQSERRARQRASTQQRSGGPPRGRKPPRQGLGRGPLIGGLVVIVLVAAGLVFASTQQNRATPGPTPTPRSLARAIDDVKCLSGEMLQYHIHQYLELYDRGKPVAVPALIGIPNNGVTATCLYYIHVHYKYKIPNIIHVESPVAVTYTLGNFFDVWKATQGSTIPRNRTFLRDLQKASKVTAFYNGKRWTRGYRSIPLTPHAVIAVEIGKPVVPPTPFTAWDGL